MLKKYPKLRGYRRSVGARAIPVNLARLDKYFHKGETVNPDILAQKKIAGRIKGKALAIKILGAGEITKALTIEGCQVSKAAKEKIEKVGGKIL